MQYQVPQFIETEDKIIGPLTLKQFLYFAAAGGISFALFFFLKMFLWVIVTFFLGIFAAALAFIKIGGRPLPKVLVSAFLFYWKPRLFIWKREIEQKTAPKVSPEPFPAEEKPAIQNLAQKLSTAKEPVKGREKYLKPLSLFQPKIGEKEYELLEKMSGEKEAAKRVDFR